MGAWKPTAAAASITHPSIPMRYAGDKLGGAAAPMVPIKVIRAVLSRCLAQTELTWQRFRREIQDIDQHASRKEVADMLFEDREVANV